MRRGLLSLALAAGLYSSLGAAMAGGGPSRMLSGGEYSRSLPVPSSSTSADVSESGYQTGPGWSAAQVKRMAKKERSRKAHRAACRRTGGRAKA